MTQKSFSWVTIEHWLDASENLSMSVLLTSYSMRGTKVDGLFLWLASISLQTYVNFAHESGAWTTHSSDVINCMDAMIVFGDEVFLIATSTTECVPKAVLKSDFMDPMTV